MVLSQGLGAKNELAVQLCWGRGRSCREDPAGSSWHKREQRCHCPCFGMTLAAQLCPVTSSVINNAICARRVGRANTQHAVSLAQVSVLPQQPLVQQAHKHWSEHVRWNNCGCVVTAPSSASWLRLCSITKQYLEASIFFSTEGGEKRVLALEISFLTYPFWLQRWCCCGEGSPLARDCG